MQKIEVYDTTLRDGTQGFGVSLSLADKLAITRELDRLGIDYIEGGWPGSNPKDQGYFQAVRELQLEHAQISAFGSTRRQRLAAENDPNLLALVESRADVTCIFGKAWDLHVVSALRVSGADNLSMIRDSVAFLRQATGRPVFYDAEHFFDGFAHNAEYALESVGAAAAAGAARLILCDTNGGALPELIAAGVSAVRARLPEAQLGIHVHNDSGLAVANSLRALQCGCIQVQGTVNGLGERCGNVDLTTVIANAELKLNLRCLPVGHLQRLTEISRFVWECINTQGPVNQPYVGEAAFAHKGGVHVSAMQRDERTYEHVSPASVGNSRQILVSEMSGRSSLLATLSHRYPRVTEERVMQAILQEIQERENAGYAYEAAQGSLDLIVRRQIGEWRPAFELVYYRVHGLGGAGQSSDSVEATVKLRIGGAEHLHVAEGNGPVDALSHALMQALAGAFPGLRALSLVDYKVRVVSTGDGTAAKVRVLIEHKLGGNSFGTLGVSANIIEASWQALVEAVEYAVLTQELETIG